MRNMELVEPERRLEPPGRPCTVARQPAPPLRPLPRQGRRKKGGVDVPSASAFCRQRVLPLARYAAVGWARAAIGSVCILPSKGAGMEKYLADLNHLRPHN